MDTARGSDRIERWLGLYQKNNEKPYPDRVWLFCVSLTREKRENDKNKSDFSGQLVREIVDYDEQHPNPEYERLHGSVYYRAWL